MYSCSQVAKWISSDEYLTAGFFKKLGIRLHLMMCQYCARYRNQLRALAAALGHGGFEVPHSEIESVRNRIVRTLH